MGDGTRSIEKGLTMVHETEEAFEEIVQTIQEISNQSRILPKIAGKPWL
jgi:methyl-accepting chemotaxis protein